MIDGQNWNGYEKFIAKSHFDFSKNSTIGCGGSARMAFYPQTLGELSSLLQQLKADEIRYYVLGNLSNVLPPDGASRRVVVKMSQFQEVDTTDGVYVSAGVTSGLLLRVCKLLNKSGAEFLAGIPCTIGGALYMNAGVSGNYIAEIVESVTILRDGKKIELPINECEYAYKSSVFMKNDDVILGARLKLADSSKERIDSQTQYFLKKRAHLPKGKSMGCVFKNPINAAPNQTAGALIEGAGMKGLRFGGAVVSDLHANFILNDGGATSAQVKTLAEIVKNAVYAQYKVRLEEEIEYLE